MPDCPKQMGVGDATGVKQARSLGLDVAYGVVEDGNFEGEFFYALEQCLRTFTPTQRNFPRDRAHSQISRYCLRNRIEYSKAGFLAIPRELVRSRSAAPCHLYSPITVDRRRGRLRRGTNKPYRPRC